MTALCPMRVVECQYCHKRERANNLMEHMRMCPEYPISCVNNCGVRFPRSQLPQHSSECELEVITCPYKEYGCNAKSMMRRDLLAHKKEFYIEHQDMSLVQIREQKYLIAELQERKTGQLDGVEWIVHESLEDKTFAGVNGRVLEGPMFHVGCYKLIVCYSFQFDELHSPGAEVHFSFFLKMINREYGWIMRTTTAITHYKLIIANQEDSTKYLSGEGAMNYSVTRNYLQFFYFTIYATLRVIH